MLTVEEHFVIKDLYRRGVSISEIARRTGHDRKTIRQRLTAPLLAEHVDARHVRNHWVCESCGHAFRESFRVASRIGETFAA